MSCDRIREWLGPYVDDEASPDVQRAVEVHVSGCGHCAQELTRLRGMAAALAPAHDPLPPELWNAIRGRIAGAAAHRQHLVFTFRRIAATAALLLIAVGVGWLALPRGWDGARSAQAATVDFGVLFDRLKMDPEGAFDAFVAQYRPEQVTPAEAKAYAPGLTFELPDVLPGGFRRVAVYELHFGDKRGVAARYEREGELLGFVFHPPILAMRFGERENRSCFVGKLGGHAVDVGEWTLSHLTDPTTCHCVLTKLDRVSELPAVLAAITPGSGALPSPSDHARH